MVETLNNWPSDAPCSDQRREISARSAGRGFFFFNVQLKIFWEQKDPPVTDLPVFTGALGDGGGVAANKSFTRRYATCG